MKRITLTTFALFIILTFVSVLFVSVVSFNHTDTEHVVSEHGSHCPFMSHEESICPMSALDHLSVLRNLFESVLPSLVIISLIIPTLLIFYSLEGRLRPPTKLRSYTSFKWHLLAINGFSYKRHQELFSSGILNPKLF